MDALMAYGEKVKLDQKDKKILSLLDHDARLTVAEISRKTGIQRDSVLYRINRMKKMRVIRFFTPSLIHLYSVTKSMRS